MTYLSVFEILYMKENDILHTFDQHDNLNCLLSNISHPSQSVPLMHLSIFKFINIDIYSSISISIWRYDSFQPRKSRIKFIRTKSVSNLHKISIKHPFLFLFPRIINAYFRKTFSIQRFQKPTR